jgi:hypothetical protein
MCAPSFSSIIWLKLVKPTRLVEDYREMERFGSKFEGVCSEPKRMKSALQKEYSPHILNRGAPKILWDEMDR